MSHFSTDSPVEIHCKAVVELVKCSSVHRWHTSYACVRLTHVGMLFEIFSDAMLSACLGTKLQTLIHCIALMYEVI